MPAASQPRRPARAFSARAGPLIGREGEPLQRAAAATTPAAAANAAATATEQQEDGRNRS